MPVPETTMNQNNRMIPGKNDIRLSRQIPVMQPLAEPPGVQSAPDHHFRLGVAPANPAHIKPTLGCSQDISHPYSQRRNLKQSS